MEYKIYKGKLVVKNIKYLILITLAIVLIFNVKQVSIRNISIISIYLK